MDYVQTKSMSMVNEHTERAISEKKNRKITKKKNNR